MLGNFPTVQSLTLGYSYSFKGILKKDSILKITVLHSLTYYVRPPLFLSLPSRFADLGIHGERIPMSQCSTKTLHQKCEESLVSIKDQITNQGLGQQPLCLTLRQLLTCLNPGHWLRHHHHSRHHHHLHAWASAMSEPLHQLLPYLLKYSQQPLRGSVITLILQMKRMRLKKGRNLPKVITFLVSGKTRIRTRVSLTPNYVPFLVCDSAYTFAGEIGEPHTRQFEDDYDSL